MKEKENFVLSAVITNECDWQIIDNSIKQIKIKHFPQILNEDVEFHAKDMLNRDDIFKNLSWSTIYALFGDIFKMISNNETNLSIISIVIEKSKIKYDMDIENWAYKLLFERLDNYMHVINDLNRESQNPNEFCIVITDTEGMKKDLLLRKKLNPILKNGTRFSPLNNIIEEIFFTDSKFRNLSQIADCVAYCVRKYHRNEQIVNQHNAYWKMFFQQISLKFYSNPITGEYLGYGLKVFPY